MEFQGGKKQFLILAKDFVSEGVNCSNVSMGLFKFLSMTSGFVMTMAGFVASTPVSEALICQEFD